MLTRYFRGGEMFSDMAEVSISLTLNFMRNFFFNQKQCIIAAV